MADKKRNISTWAVGGGLVTGIGVGFFFLKSSGLAFLGCMLIGLGLGLLAAAVLSRAGKSSW